MKNTSTSTYRITVLLARSNGHDITDGALKRATLDTDLAGLEVECDDLIVHDITEGQVRRADDHLVACSYDVVVEGVDCDTGEPITGDALFDLLDEVACCCPAEGWEHVHHTIIAR